MVNKVMAWLRSGRHRMQAAVLLTVLIVISFNVLAQSPEFKLKYTENAGYIKFFKGDEFGSAICLDTKTEASNSEALPDGWRAVTCNDMNTPIRWHLCYINIDKGSFICGVKPS